MSETSNLQQFNRNLKPEELRRYSQVIAIKKLSSTVPSADSRRKNSPPKHELEVDAHVISEGELYIRFSTKKNYGLTYHQAAHLLRQNGPNTLVAGKQRPKCALLFEFLFCGFSLLLWFGAVLCFIGFAVAYIQDPFDTTYDQLYLGTVIVVVIIITGLFGFYQESANTAIMDSFKKMIPKYATVLREGEWSIIPSEQIVIGDIVRVNAGSCIPADIRIIEAQYLKVDNSSITGESEPLPRSKECTDTNPLETANLAFYGTNVIEGTGDGVVIACGKNTLMGHIAALTANLQSDETPIKKELKKFIRIITIFSVVAGLLFFTIAMLVAQMAFVDAFVFFIGVVVANVPEGLLVTMTAALTLTAKKMARKNCLCKNLHAIETLGSTTVICSDKTGTLTQNKMTVAHIYFDEAIHDILSEQFTPPTTSNFKSLCRVGILCNKAEFLPDQEDIDIDDRNIQGDASESGVLKCMERLYGQTTEFRNRHPKVLEIPFNSTNKYQVSVHNMPDSNHFLLVMKGAPERILDRCKTCETAHGDVPMDEALEKKFRTAILELGYMGERVLGFADRILTDESFQNPDFEWKPENIEEELSMLRFVGLMAMIDPPRNSVPEAIRNCQSAGIKVVMVTGDHPITAMAIARKVGIISPSSDTVYDIAMRKNISIDKVNDIDVMNCKATVITGADLKDMDSDDLEDVILRHQEIVFARTSPQQKLLIVEAFQSLGEVVAVTGDGVNDSPALKKADIGVAMGISGSEVSKEAADMIILDDNFASIVVGIEEGRLIFDNLKKSIAYMLTSNVPEMVPFLVHVLLGMPLPLHVMTILIIDVGTDLWPGISLAYERPEADIMQRKPRDPKKDNLVTWKLIWFTTINIGFVQALASLSCYLYVMSEHGFLPEKLLFIREEWGSSKSDMIDSFGQEWDRADRTILERKAISASFLAIVITQIADCIICKTRRLSIVHQGMHNTVMNLGIVFEVCVAIFVVYTPHVNDALRLASLKPYFLLPSIPFALIIIIFDETRKYIIRNNPGGWVERETYF